MFFSRYLSAPSSAARTAGASRRGASPPRRRARRTPRSSTASPWSISAGKPIRAGAALADLHQLGQFAEGPGGVSGRARDGRRLAWLSLRPRCRLGGRGRRRRRERQVLLPGASSRRPSSPPAPGTPRAPARPAPPSAPPRLRPMPSWRPCSSTTRKFMNRCAGSMSSLKSARLTSRLVSSRTTFSSASVSEPLPEFARRAAGRQPRRRLRQRHEARARPLRQALQQACTLSLSMPGTSHSARSSLTWFSTNSGTVTVRPSRQSPGSCR